MTDSQFMFSKLKFFIPKMLNKIRFDAERAGMRSYVNSMNVNGSHFATRKHKSLEINLKEIRRSFGMTQLRFINFNPK